jgi:C4-type Zn-finger protein
MGRTWIYHETEEPIIIEREEVESYEEKGWKDSPAFFIKLPDFGVDPDDAMAVQALGETVEGVVNSLNGALNINEMDKHELEEYAREHFGAELDKRQKLKTLKKQVQSLIDGPTEH